MSSRNSKSTVTANVAPYNLPDSNNLRLLSALKTVPSITSSHIQTIPDVKPSIPTFTAIDISEFVDSNTRKLVTKKSLESKPKSTEDEALLQDIPETDEEPVKYVAIDSILPKTLKDQLSTVIIRDFPNTKRIAIEKILSALVSDEFTWSHVNYEYIDKKVVFVRFAHLSSVKWFYENYKDNLGSIMGSEKTKVYVDPTVEEYLEKIEVDTGKVRASEKVLASKVSQLLKFKDQKNIKHSGTEDLDAALNYYSSYKVDNNELVDVPNSMKDIIVKDIVKFRSKVLTIERDNRKREIEMERMKTKERLKRIFEGDTIDRQEDTIVEDEKPVEENIDETETMTEQEYEEYLAEQEQNRLEKEYKFKLEAVHKLESERETLIAKLDDLNNYEANLLENKFKYIEDTKAYQDDKESSLSSLIRMYHNDHSQYLKFRQQKRSLEESQDQLDIEEEAKEAKSTEEAGEFLNNLKKQKIEPPKEDIKMEETSTQNQIKISELPTEATEKLQRKVVELVEEYLGIKDDFLIDVIIENVTSHNLDGREDLINDLTEVLDEDANNLVNDLWEYIKQI